MTILPFHPRDDECTGLVVEEDERPLLSFNNDICILGTCRKVLGMTLICTACLALWYVIVVGLLALS